LVQKLVLISGLLFTRALPSCSLVPGQELGATGKAERLKGFELIKNMHLEAE